MLINDNSFFCVVQNRAFWHKSCTKQVQTIESIAESENSVIPQVVSKHKYPLIFINHLEKSTVLLKSIVLVSKIFGYSW